MNYFSPIPPREDPHMEFPLNKLDSQMFQHLADLFGICQDRMHHHGGAVQALLPCFSQHN